MQLVNAWKNVVVEQYSNFSGRARRAEYWWFVLANLIVVVVLLALSAVSSVFLWLYIIYLLAVLIPSVAVGVRRLHDTDKSGWFMLIALIPFVGSIILLVFLATDGTRGTNAYGTSPKYPT